MDFAENRELNFQFDVNLRLLQGLYFHLPGCKQDNENAPCVLLYSPILPSIGGPSQR